MERLVPPEEMLPDMDMSILLLAFRVARSLLREELLPDMDMDMSMVETVPLLARRPAHVGVVISGPS